MMQKEIFEEYNVMEQDIKDIDPEKYFQELKRSKQVAANETLKIARESCYFLLGKALTAGQTNAAQKIIFHMNCVEKEYKLLELGINKFVYKSDIQKFIDIVDKEVIKIIELRRYERELPQEAVETVAKTKGIFDEYYVVFTDYTGEVERSVEQEKKRKDPILFGVFNDASSRAVVERFYFLAEWEDEYCDSTLDKMVTVMSSDMVKEIKIVKSIDDFREQIKSLVKNPASSEPNFLLNNVSTTHIKEKESFFKKIKSFFK